MDLPTKSIRTDDLTRPKSTISWRIYTDVKRELERQAIRRGQNLSQYLSDLLLADALDLDERSKLNDSDLDRIGSVLGDMVEERLAMFLGDRKPSLSTTIKPSVGSEYDWDLAPVLDWTDGEALLTQGPEKVTGAQAWYPEEEGRSGIQPFKVLCTLDGPIDDPSSILIDLRQMVRDRDERIKELEDYARDLGNDELKNSDRIQAELNSVLDKKMKTESDLEAANVEILRLKKQISKLEKKVSSFENEISETKKLLPPETALVIDLGTKAKLDAVKKGIEAYASKKKVPAIEMSGKVIPLALLNIDENGWSGFLDKETKNVFKKMVK
ncbi:MAG: hypothetical protein AAF798_19440 [Bacteroidota bacterium]